MVIKFGVFLVLCMCKIPKLWTISAKGDWRSICIKFQPLLFWMSRLRSKSIVRKKMVYGAKKERVLANLSSMHYLDGHGRIDEWVDCSRHRCCCCCCCCCCLVWSGGQYVIIFSLDQFWSVVPPPHSPLSFFRLRNTSDTIKNVYETKYHLAVHLNAKWGMGNFPCQQFSFQKKSAIFNWQSCQHDWARVQSDWLAGWLARKQTEMLLGDKAWSQQWVRMCIYTMTRETTRIIGRMYSSLVQKYHHKRDSIASKWGSAIQISFYSENNRTGRSVATNLCHIIILINGVTCFFLLKTSTQLPFLRISYGSFNLGTIITSFHFFVRKLIIIIKKTKKYIRINKK